MRVTDWRSMLLPPLSYQHKRSLSSRDPALVGSFCVQGQNRIFSRVSLCDSHLTKLFRMTWNWTTWSERSRSKLSENDVANTGAIYNRSPFIEKTKCSLTSEPAHSRQFLQEQGWPFDHAPVCSNQKTQKMCATCDADI
jgi:hypothetical protein